MEQYDSLVIGCGPAGIQASIYLGRSGLKTVLLGKKDGSRLKWAHIIENYFGFSEGIDGDNLLENGISQAKKCNVNIVDDEVLDVKKENGVFLINCTKNDFLSKSIIFATGVTNQSSGVPKEKDFIGKGIAYCVMCDGVFFKDKKVVVVGEGDYAAKEALELLDYTKNVSLCSNGKDFTISDKYLDSLKNSGVRLFKEKLTSFLGDTSISGASLENSKSIDFDGAFIAVGMSGSATLSMNIGVLINNNYILVDDSCKTNVSGVFAAGDVTGSGMQVSTAVGSGAKAAMSAISYVKGLVE